MYPQQKRSNRNETSKVKQEKTKNKNNKKKVLNSGLGRLPERDFQSY
jgi:hypothetical protein